MVGQERADLRLDEPEDLTWHALPEGDGVFVPRIVPVDTTRVVLAHPTSVIAGERSGKASGTAVRATVRKARRPEPLSRRVPRIRRRPRTASSCTDALCCSALSPGGRARCDIARDADRSPRARAAAPRSRVHRSTAGRPRRRSRAASKGVGLRGARSRTGWSSSSTSASTRWSSFTTSTRFAIVTGAAGTFRSRIPKRGPRPPPALGVPGV